MPGAGASVATAPAAGVAGWYAVVLEAAGAADVGAGAALWPEAPEESDWLQAARATSAAPASAVRPRVFMVVFMFVT